MEDIEASSATMPPSAPRPPQQVDVISAGSDGGSSCDGGGYAEEIPQAGLLPLLGGLVLWKVSQDTLRHKGTGNCMACNGAGKIAPPPPSPTPPSSS